MTLGLQLGRPGVYAVPQREDRGLRPVRLDVAGFVGVALRGPVDTPVLVTSWSDYERVFGGFERAPDAPERLLPYAVRAFFAQGGARAFVVRVAPPPTFRPLSEDATARYVLDPTGAGRWSLVAANEGTWGTSLRIELAFEVTETFRASVVSAAELDLPAGARPCEQSLVRVRGRGIEPTGTFAWISWSDDPRTPHRVALEPALRAAVVDDVDAANDDDDEEEVDVDVDVITGVITVADTSDALRREERLGALGLRPGHPRFVPVVLATESTLVRGGGRWDEPLVPDRFLTPRRAERTRPGLDRSHGIGFWSFFDDGEPGSDPLDERTSHRGVDAIAREPELGILCVPDLTWRSHAPTDPPPPPTPRLRPRTACDACAPLDDVPDDLSEQPPIPGQLDADDLAEILARQSHVVRLAELFERFVVLLDVPRGLSVRGITGWRAAIESSYAAAYHPWLGEPSGSDVRGRLVFVPPSSYAAGILASREQRFGLPWGPANEVAQGAVLAAQVISDAVHDQLHLLAINVYRQERGGFRLSAARTLSTDREYSQLSVRRFMTMLRLTIERQTQWLAFEPNTAELRARLTHTLTQLLRELRQRGSFAGRIESEAFFVRCDDALNPAASQGQGRLLAEIGVAVASPIEYLILRISRDADGVLSVGAPRG